MTTTASQTARVNDLLARWKAHRAALPEPGRYCQIKTDLYQVRNPGWNGSPPLTAWPSHLVDSGRCLSRGVVAATATGGCHQNHGHRRGGECQASRCCAHEESP